VRILLAEIYKLEVVLTPLLNSKAMTGTTKMKLYFHESHEISTQDARRQRIIEY
jgi:hypothetical protein